MSLLAILLPGRGRTPPIGESSATSRVDPSSDSAPEWRFVFSRDGQTVAQEGSVATSQLPKAERVVLVAQDEDVSWLSVKLPKAAASRLKEVLGGALEDQLLEDPAQTHLAISRMGLREDEPTWVAALHRPWLEHVLSQLSEQGLQADALVSLSEPEPTLRAHARLSVEGMPLAVVSGPHGVASWPLGWAGWRSRLSETPSWTAEPAAAQALSEVGESSGRLVSASERALGAAASGTNLLQFGLTPQMKGSRAVLAAWSAFKERRYRAIHVGLIALILIQAIGLNLSAWSARQDVRQVQSRSEQLLREAFPSIKVVVDPVVQAERELQTLRSASGEPGPTDLETWIDLTATVWAGQPAPLKTLRLDAQGLSLEAAQWPEELVAVMQDYARQQGWQAQLNGGVLRLSKSAMTSTR